jgi:hypothetical protein
MVIPRSIFTDVVDRQAFFDNIRKKVWVERFRPLVRQFLEIHDTTLSSYHATRTLQSDGYWAFPSYRYLDFVLSAPFDEFHSVYPFVIDIHENAVIFEDIQSWFTRIAVVIKWDVVSIQNELYTGGEYEPWVPRSGTPSIHDLLLESFTSAPYSTTSQSNLDGGAHGQVGGPLPAIDLRSDDPNPEPFGYGELSGVKVYSKTYNRLEMVVEGSSSDSAATGSAAGGNGDGNNGNNDNNNHSDWRTAPIPSDDDKHKKVDWLWIPALVITCGFIARKKES